MWSNNHVFLWSIFYLWSLNQFFMWSLYFIYVVCILHMILVWVLNVILVSVIWSLYCSISLYQLSMWSLHRFSMWSLLLSACSLPHHMANMVVCGLCAGSNSNNCGCGPIHEPSPTSRHNCPGHFYRRRQHDLTKEGEYIWLVVYVSTFDQLCNTMFQFWTVV